MRITEETLLKNITTEIYRVNLYYVKYGNAIVIKELFNLETWNRFNIEYLFFTTKKSAKEFITNYLIKSK